MAKMASKFQTPRTLQKYSEVKYFFDFRESIYSIGYKKILLETITTIIENLLSKKNPPQA